MKKIYHYHIYNTNLGDRAIHEGIWQMVEEAYSGEIEWVKMDLNNDECTMEVIERMNADGDMLIIGGSGLYSNFYWKNYEGAHWYFPCNWKNYVDINIPIVIWGSGMNMDFLGTKEKPLSKEAEEAIKVMHQFTALSSVRDLYTYAYVTEKLGLKDIKMIQDPAYFLKSEKFETGVNEKRCNIGINLAGHTEGARLSRDMNWHYIMYLLKEINSNADMDLYYFKHHKACSGNIDKLKKSGIELKGVFDREPKEMVYAYSKMDRVINMMMHSMILCDNASVFYRNIPYNIKNINYMHIKDTQLEQSMKWVEDVVRLLGE